MPRKILVLPLILLLSILSSCASLQPGYEKPVVTISSFEAIPTQNLLPRFKIGLHIINPNRTALTLRGISYTLSLEGHKIMTGVTNKLPRIEPYGEGDVDLNASVDLFSSIRFFTNLMRNQKKDKLSYSFDGKLDVGTLYPLIRIKKEGTLFLTQSKFE
ncbi:MAG: LEA type 2 family protein [Desulfobacula sp.]|nr:LEA type 2 family protein [Desulfobacula sp.]